MSKEGRINVSAMRQNRVSLVSIGTYIEPCIDLILTLLTIVERIALIIAYYHLITEAAVDCTDYGRKKML